MSREHPDHLGHLDAHPGREPRRTQPSSPSPVSIPWALGLETSLLAQSHRGHLLTARVAIRGGCCGHQGRGRHVPAHFSSLLPLCWWLFPKMLESSRASLQRDVPGSSWSLSPRSLLVCAHPVSSASHTLLSCCSFINKKKEETRSQRTASRNLMCPSHLLL